MADKVEARRAVKNHAAKAIADDARLAAALKAISKGAFSDGAKAAFANIVENVSGPDYFLVASDFADYWRAQRDVDTAYTDQNAWMRSAALNTARSGWFSSDRTIKGYNADIWNAQPLI